MLAIQQVTGSNARVEQDVLLAVISNNLLLRKHVQRFITQRRKKPKNKKHWGHFQNAALLASQPYTPIIEKGVKRFITQRRKKPKLKKHWGMFQNAALLAARPLGPPVVRGMRVVHRHVKKVVPHHIHFQRVMGGSKRRQPFVFVSC